MKYILQRGTRGCAWKSELLSGCQYFLSPAIFSYPLAILKTYVSKKLCSFIHFC